MKIYVCVKQIPDPNTVVSKLDPNTKRLVRSGVSLVLDPGDESTISAAIKLRDTVGSSEVTAVCMGPASAQEAMRRALAMGVDRAILVTDPDCAIDRKSTRLNSSHRCISYAVFCLKK